MKWRLSNLAMAMVLGCGAGQAEPLVATPVGESPAPVEPSIEPSGAIVFGDTYIIFTEEDDPPLTLFVAHDPEPAPDVAPIGTVEVHAGIWTIRVLDDAPNEYRTASVIDGTSVCEARVTRTRLLHAQLPSNEHDPSSGGEWTFLALELEGCLRGSMGVAGAAVRVHSCDYDAVETPADPPLVEVVRSADESLGWGDPLEPSQYRMIELPQHQITVVVGHGAWVVRDGGLLTERHHGIPRSVIEAGDRVFFQMTAPSEDWAASLEHFSAADADASP